MYICLSVISVFEHCPRSLFWSFDLHTRNHVATRYAGSHKHSGHRGIAHNVKDADGSSIVSEVKPLKRGGSSSYVFHEVCLQLKL